MGDGLAQRLQMVVDAVEPSVTDRTVRVMLVPVSPSGTGYTFKLSMTSRCSDRAS